MYGTYNPNQKVWFDQNFSTSRYNKSLKKYVQILKGLALYVLICLGTASAYGSANA